MSYKESVQFLAGGAKKTLTLHERGTLLSHGRDCVTLVSSNLAAITPRLGSLGPGYARCNLCEQSLPVVLLNFVVVPGVLGDPVGYLTSCLFPFVPTVWEFPFALAFCSRGILCCCSINSKRRETRRVFLMWQFRGIVSLWWQPFFRERSHHDGWSYNPSRWFFFNVCFLVQFWQVLPFSSRSPEQPSHFCGFNSPSLP